MRSKENQKVRKKWRLEARFLRTFLQLQTVSKGEYLANAAEGRLSKELRYRCLWLYERLSAPEEEVRAP